MRIDLGTSDEWLKACAAYRAALPQELQDPLLNVQIYGGYQAALREITLSLGRLFAHKRTVAIVTENELAFQDIAALFSGEGYQVRELKSAELRDTSTWLPAVQSELLFVLYAIDDPVTGRGHEVESFEAAVASARFHRIALSHAAHRFAPLARPRPFDVRVLSLSSTRALLFAGERGKIQPQITQLLPWSVSDERAQALLSGAHDTDSGASVHVAGAPAHDGYVQVLRQAVEAFEAKLPAGCHALFKPGEARVPDRVVFYHEGVDGLALITELKAQGIQADAAGGDPALETMSACRWGNPRVSEWLRGQGLTLEQQRGLVVFDAGLLLSRESGVDEISTKLARALERVLSLQRGD